MLYLFLSHAMLFAYERPLCANSGRSQSSLDQACQKPRQAGRLTSAKPDRKALKNFKLQINDLRPPQLDLAHIDQVDRTRWMVLSKSGVRRRRMESGACSVKALS
jgi:hypothetical protein